jgi:hypothetical protein
MHVHDTENRASTRCPALPDRCPRRASARSSPAVGETRWPEPATVPDWLQGVPLSDLQQLCTYWRTEYDWRAAEHRLNRWPQYLIDIDELTVHYFHLPSASSSAVAFAPYARLAGVFLRIRAGDGTAGGVRFRARGAVPARIRLQRQTRWSGLGRASNSTGMGRADATSGLPAISCLRQRK